MFLLAEPIANHDLTELFVARQELIEPPGRFSKVSLRAAGGPCSLYRSFADGK